MAKNANDVSYLTTKQRKRRDLPIKTRHSGLFITSDGGREHKLSQEAINLIHGKDSSAKNTEQYL
ncbi:ATP-dependent 6-phosphofructokinase [Bienertia sinuspersici]